MKYFFLLFLLFSIGSVQAQQDDGVNVYATIMCECIDIATIEEWQTKPEEILNECEKGAIIGAMISVLPTGDANSTSSTTDVSGATQFGKKERDEAYKILESNCGKYQDYTKKKGKDFTDLRIKVVETSCTCVGEISTALPRTEKNKRIQQCMIQSVREEREKGADTPLTVEEIRGFYDQLRSDLTENCEAVEKVVFANDEEKLNSYSNDEKALDYYTKGQDAFQEGELKKAVRHYKKAVSIDNEFVFAWDNLGRTYRELGEYDKAIDAYLSSLKVDSLNRTSLMNIAVAYTYKKDLASAQKYYEMLKSYYPEDPESPYGLALIHIRRGELDDALLNAISAYKLYQKSNSPYQADAQKLITYLYGKFNNAGRGVEFKKTCKENEINPEFK